MTRRYLLLVACLYLAYVFIDAGIPKIKDPAAFARIIYNYQLAPSAWINLAAIYLPWLEIALGLFILWPRSRDAAALIVTVLLLVFTAAIISALARVLNISCGCFTTDPDANKAGIQNVARNVGFIAVAVFVLVMSFKTRSTPYGESTTLYGN